MPADPSENLPLAQLHVPLLLNGRPTAPTTAAAVAAASLARRRQQQQAAAQAAAAQQHQAQLLAAAAAAQAAAVRQEEYKTDIAELTGVVHVALARLLYTQFTILWVLLQSNRHWLDGEGTLLCRSLACQAPSRDNVTVHQWD
jgi:hypothetical protein